MYVFDTEYRTVTVRRSLRTASDSVNYLDEHFWVDEYSKIIFPTCFAIFNIIFWTYALAFDYTLLEEIQAAGYEKLASWIKLGWYIIPSQHYCNAITDIHPLPEIMI